jgi:hypothetical protein
MRKLFTCSAHSILPFFNFYDPAATVDVLVPADNERNIKSFGKHSITKAFLFSVFMFSFINGFTQSSFRKNAIYGELAGDGIFLSLHYERQLGTKPGLGVHFGLGNADIDENFAFTIPVGVDYLFNISNQKSFIETGLGVTWAIQNIWDSYSHTEPHKYKPAFISSIGYRHQTPYGLMWKIGAIAAFSKNNILPFYPGISIGWRF